MNVRTDRRALLPVLALAILSAGQAIAGERFERRHESSSRVYYDYAPVIDVRALREPAVVPAACRSGAPDADDALPKLGVVREHAASIASAIVQEAEARAEAEALAREQRDRCKRQRSTPRVTGYEVLYRYRGTDYRRVMSRHPGDEVRVRVELRAP